MSQDTATTNRVAETPLARVLARWPTSRRRRIATVLALVGILVATVIASSRILRLLHQELDIVAYAGLFATCWIGAGGALVPVPGVRPISWFMVVQQGAVLDPVVVALVAATAMTLGQTSYFVAARARRRALDHPTAPPVATLDLDPADLDPAVLADPVGPPDASDGPPPSSAPRRHSERMERARRRVTRQVQTHGMAPVVAVCALPSPLTTLTTTAAAAAGMGFARYLPAAFGGFLVLSHRGGRGCAPGLDALGRSGYKGHMKTASITEAKNGLSALLDQVKAGESVLITDRGVPVARIEPVSAADDTEAWLLRLERKGLIRRGNGMPPDELLRRMAEIPRPRLPEGMSVVEALLEERESGW